MKTLAEEEGIFASGSFDLETTRDRGKPGQRLTQSRRGTRKNGFAMLSSLSLASLRGPLCFLSLGIALLFLVASSARANTWTVNTLQDSNDGSCAAKCSLRDAITAAKSDTSGNVLINFSSSVTGTITLTNTLPDIKVSMTIQGPGANLLTISGSGQYRIFNITNEATSVSISNLTLANGRIAGGNGGAINSNAASLTITNCTFSNNVVPGSSNDSTFGGAIYDTGGTLTVTNCTFFDNRAPSGCIFNGCPVGGGGAIYYAHNALTVTNSTFSGNSVSDGYDGGAIYTNSGTITNSTFHGNSAGLGGAIHTNSGTITNSTFHGNSAGVGGAIYTNSGTITNSIFNRNSGYDSAIYHTRSVSQSYDLFYKNSSPRGIGLNYTDVSADPMLLPLGNYGGPTVTMMPQVGSAAICAGEKSALTSALSGLPQTDQRGWPVSPTVGECTNGKVDVGSVQTNYLLVTSTSGTGSGTLPGAVSQANTENTDADIGFSLGTSPATITLDSLLSLSSGDTLFLGLPDPVTISGGKSTQILSLTGSASAMLYDLTLEDGSATNGGALDNEGTGTLTVFSNTLSGNQATDKGGAIENGGTGNLAVTDSTFSGNSVGGGGDGGAIDNEGSGTLTVTNSTFSGNQAGSSTSSGDGGAIYDAGGALVLADNIFSSGNSDGSTGVGGVSYGGTSITENHNLFYDNGTGGDASGFDPSSNSTDVTGTSADPKLASLGNYGGPTQTMLPLPGSPAMCEGATALPSPLVLPASGQRGFPRTTSYPGIHTTCADIGAVQAYYTSIQFTNVPTGGYTAIEHHAVNPPAPNISVTEQGVASVGGVPLTLSLNPVPNPPATGVMATTAAGAGATFGSLFVDALGGTYTLSSRLVTTTRNTGFNTNPNAKLTILSYEQAAIHYISTITTLTSGQVNSMDRELNKAYSMALDGKFKGAINNLEDFISEVNDLYSSGVLTQEQANTLLGYANDAINLYKQGLL